MQAQPYAGGYYGDPGAPAPTPYANGLTVTAPPYRHQEANGTMDETVAASRVVYLGDLDLDTGWGVHVMHQRIERAASAVCRQLDDQWTRGLYPVQPNDADCYRRAVAQAMANAPVGVDADYSGY